jgi:hypothetical protein
MAIVPALLAHGTDACACENVGATPLHWAFAYADREVTKLLLEHRADVTAIDDLGQTPLHWMHSPFLSRAELRDSDDRFFIAMSKGGVEEVEEDHEDEMEPISLKTDRKKPLCCKTIVSLVKRALRSAVGDASEKFLASKHQARKANLKNLIPTMSSITLREPLQGRHLCSKFFNSDFNALVCHP